MASYTQLVSSTRAVFMTGRTKTLDWRRKQLNGLLRFLDEQKSAIATALKQDLNKHNLESAVTEIDFVRNDVIHTLDHLEDWMQPEKVKRNLMTMMDDAYIKYEPYGVVLIIGAWNYPIQVALGPMVGALASGNCVLLKPSEVAVNTAKLIESCSPQYFDRECVHIVSGGVPETTALLKEQFDHIFYTGNPTVAKVIYQAAVQYLTPVTLELGGKSPVYVDGSSDLSVVARRLIWGKFMNSGQTCIAPDYVMCTKELQGPLVDECKSVLKSFYGDDPKQSDSYGRMVNSRHVERVRALLGDSKVAVGGTFDVKCNYIAPTILTDVKPTDAVMQDEIFGPVMPIMPVSGVDEAVQYINSHDKPLAMYIFSKDSSVVDQILSSTSSGGVTVNDTLMHPSLHSLPFGGVGNSGFGAYHGKFSFDVFSHKRACLIRKQGMEKLNDVRYPPYSDKKLRIISWATRKNPKSFMGSVTSFLPIVIIGVILGYFLKVLGLGNYVRRG